MISRIKEIDCFCLIKKPLIDKAITNRRFTQLTNFEHVVNQLKKGLMQLWYCQDQNGECVILTSIVTYPETKILELNYAGGERIEGFFLEAYESLKAFGREQDCNQIRGFGRRGWLKLIPDNYRETVQWDVDL